MLFCQRISPAKKNLLNYIVQSDKMGVVFFCSVIPKNMLGMETVVWFKKYKIGPVISVYSMACEFLSF